MSENAMGYRGSKSIVSKNTVVKEQRVDGSYIEYFVRSRLRKKIYSMLRYTLVGFERSYHTKIPSNFINLKRNFSTLESKLNPFYVTGFVDGEGSFILTIIRDNKYKSG